MIKFFSIVLSLQLILSPLAFAVDDTESARRAGLSDAYLKTGTGSSGGYDFYVSQVMSLATSSIGSSILTQCLEGLKTPSIATFMAGSLTHIMSEILGAKAKTDRHKKKMKDLKIKFEELKKSGDSAQFEALKSALQEEKDTRDFLNNRKKWMIAVTAIYSAAMGLAIAEEVYGLASGVSTSGAFCTAYTASCTVGAAFCGTQCAAGVKSAIVKIKAYEKLPQARELLTAECAEFSPGLGGCMTLVQLYLNLVYGSCLMLPTDGGVSLLSWSGLLNTAYAFGASQQASSGGAVMQYGTLLITLLPLISQNFSKLVVQMYNFPIPRSITFGAAALFAGTVTTGLAKRYNIADENVTKLENAVIKFKVENVGPGEGVASDAPKADDYNVNPNGTSPTRGNVRTLADGAKPKECFSKGANGFSLSAAGCANPIKFGSFKPMNFPIPAINQVGSLAGTLGAALASGDEIGAAKIAGEIGQYAARVKAETDKLKAQYNEMQKKENRPQTDFDKSVQGQVASLQKELEKAAASKNINLASAGAAFNDEKSEESKGPTGEAVAGTSDASGPAVAQPAIPTPDFSSTDPLTDGAAAGAEALAANSAPTQGLEDFESTENDISSKPEVNIFKQVSNRYLLNYTKIFDRKKDPAPETKP